MLFAARKCCLWGTVVLVNLALVACSDDTTSGSDAGVNDVSMEAIVDVMQGGEEAGTMADSAGTVIPASWKEIPAGTFRMGSPVSEWCRETLETEHEVVFTNAFEMQSTEVSQGQFEALMGYNPSHFGASGDGADCGETCPVEMVSWHESVAYCNALSSKAGLATCYDCTGSGAAVICEVKTANAGSAIYDCVGYRLPTESEWEYAYRARAVTAYHNGANDGSACLDCAILDPNLDAIGWYCGNSGDTPHPVGEKTPNAWGLYDMAGNVWEWCHDLHDSYPVGVSTDPAGAATGNRRVRRGGSWQHLAYYARAAYRSPSVPELRSKSIGFRCARTK